jgi:hypothetical protein
MYSTHTLSPASGLLNLLSVESTSFTPSCLEARRLPFINNDSPSSRTAGTGDDDARRELRQTTERSR